MCLGLLAPPASEEQVETGQRSVRMTAAEAQKEHKST